MSRQTLSSRTGCVIIASFQHAGHVDDCHRRCIPLADSRNHNWLATRVAELSSTRDWSVMVVAPFVPKRCKTFDAAQLLVLQTTRPFGASLLRQLIVPAGRICS